MTWAASGSNEHLNKEALLATDATEKEPCAKKSGEGGFYVTSIMADERPHPHSAGAI